MAITVGMASSSMPLKCSTFSEPLNFKRSFQGSCDICSRQDETLHLVLCRPTKPWSARNPQPSIRPNPWATFTSQPGARTIPSLPLAMGGSPETRSILAKSDVLLCTTCVATAARNKRSSEPGEQHPVSIHVPLAGLDESTHSKTVRQMYDDALDMVFGPQFYPAEGALVFLAIVLNSPVFQTPGLDVDRPMPEGGTTKDQITKPSGADTGAEALKWLAAELIDKLTINPCLSPDFVPYAHIQALGIMPRPLAYVLKQQLADFAIASRERCSAEPDWEVVQKASNRSSGLLRYPLAGFRIMLRATRVMYNDGDASDQLRDEDYAATLRALLWQRLLYLLVENFVDAWSFDPADTKDDNGNVIFSMPGSDLIWTASEVHVQTQDNGHEHDTNELGYKAHKPELFVPLSRILDSALVTAEDLASLQDIEQWHLLQRLITANTSYGYALGLFLHCLSISMRGKTDKGQKDDRTDCVGAWLMFRRMTASPTLQGVLERPDDLSQAEAEECWTRLYGEAVVEVDPAVS